MKKTIKQIVSIGVLGFSLLLGSFALNPQSTSAAPFVCEPAFYQVTVWGLFQKLDPNTGNYETIGASAPFLNAIGYNVEDNYIYGINNHQDDPPTLIRIEDDASYTDLGTPAGLTNGSVSGDFDHSGNLYIATSPTTLHSVNVSTMTATEISLSQSISGANDLVYINDHLYGTNGTTLFDIEIATGNVTHKPLGIPSGVHGAGWATVDDRLYFSNNISGIIYEITDYNTGTPSAIAALAGESGLTQNDGASCSLAPTAIITANARNDEATVKSGETLEKSAEEGVLINDEPGNATVTDYTQPSHGTVTVNPDGSYIYEPDEGFVGTDTFTYTISDSVGNTSTATVTIVVTEGDDIDEEPIEEEAPEVPAGIGPAGGQPPLPIVPALLSSAAIIGAAFRHRNNIISFIHRR